MSIAFQNSGCSMAQNGRFEDCYGVVVNERTLYSTINNSVRQVGIRWCRVFVVILFQSCIRNLGASKKLCSKRFAGFAGFTS